MDKLILLPALTPFLCHPCCPRKAELGQFWSQKRNKSARSLSTSPQNWIDVCLHLLSAAEQCWESKRSRVHGGWGGPSVSAGLGGPGASLLQDFLVRSHPTSALLGFQASPGNLVFFNQSFILRLKHSEELCSVSNWAELRSSNRRPIQDIYSSIFLALL